jgi:hypothetical protein
MNIIPNLIERIITLDPDAVVTVRGNDYDTLEWHPDNANPSPPSAADCLVVDLTTVRRQKAIDFAKARLDDDPVLATLVKGVVDLTVATTNLTAEQAKQRLLDDLASRL